MYLKFIFKRRDIRIFLLFVLLLTSPMAVCAQHKISLSFKDTPLKTVLKEVTKQTGYTFIYSDYFSQMNNNVTISLNSPNESIENILNQLLKDKGISYEIKEQQIMLAPVSITPVKPQLNAGPNLQRNVSGKISDDVSEPVIGVAVQNIRTKKYTASNLDGTYTIEANEGDILSFTSIGMVEYTATVSKGDVLNISMKPDAIALEDVVVTGYQTLSRERSTGSFNVVKAEQIEKPTSNIASRIIGTSSGVQAKTDIEGNVTFEIRGQTSLIVNAQPLVVVDGFPIQGGFNSINPNDVESITILKDAAAASIWGAKSANGVVVIVTKSGSKSKKGEVKVDVSSFWKFSPKIDLDYLDPVASSAEVIDYERKGYSPNGFFGNPLWVPNEDSAQKYFAHSLSVTALNEHRLGYLTESEMDNTLRTLAGQNNRDQIKDYILDNPFTQQYNINISGSTDRANHMLSLMYENGNGEYQGIQKDKYNVSYRTNVKLFKWLDFSFGGNFNMTNNKNNSVYWNGQPYEMLINEDGSRNSVIQGMYYYMPNILRNVPIDNFPYSDWTYNPISEREGRDFQTKTINFRVQGGLTVKVLKGLILESKIQYEQIKIEKREIQDESTFAVRDFINTTSSWDQKTNKVTANLPKGGFLDQSSASQDAYNWRNQLSFNRSFDEEKHQMSFIVGTEIASIVDRTTKNPRVFGYNDDELMVGTFPNGVGGSGIYKLTNWQGQNQTFSYTHKFSHQTEKYFSLYSNLSYTFNKRYTVSGSVRTDASNLITDDPKYRYAPFWSVGLSWNMLKESFMKDISWLDRLSVRATYGYNGNVDRSTSFMPLINVGTTQNNYIQDYTASISSFGNPSLRWEKTGSFDLGVDYSIFGGKLYGKIDFYNKKGKDLIVSMSIPSVNGTKTQKLNAAEMTNRGVELEFGTSLNIYERNIIWTGGLNFSYNYNKIDNLFRSSYNGYELYEGGVRSYVQGYNSNTLWSFKYAGVINGGTAANPNWLPVVQGKGDDLYDFKAWTPGDAREYMLNMGTKVAPYIIGFTSNFKIYDFDFSFIVTGKFGHVFNGFTFNYPAMTTGSTTGRPNKLYSEILNADPNERVPIPFGKGANNYFFWNKFYPYLDYNVQKAGHVKLQEVNISYNVPMNFLKKIGLTNAKVYVQGNNLLTISNNKYNEDPEYPIGSLKPLASFILGINLTF